MAFVVKYAGMHSPEGLPKANSRRRASVDVVCSLRDYLRMKHLLFSAIMIVAFMAGCVDSKETRTGAQSAMSQAEPDRLDALFSHPSRLRHRATANSYTTVLNVVIRDRFVEKDSEC